MAPRTPPGLDVGGRKLWADVATTDLDAVQKVQLLEACRAKDRLDKLDEILRGDVETRAALTQANATANLMKQLLAALRLPDEAGKRPQYRGPRGAQAPSMPGGKVSSLDRARAAKSS
jgi:hypothetical protein